jgi:hypothetical protein
LYTGCVTHCWCYRQTDKASAFPCIWTWSLCRPLV